MYVEEKYNFKFHFDENSPCLHEQPFGCCSYNDICQKENYCIIPEKIGDGKKHCMLGKRKGFDKIKAVVRVKKTANFKHYEQYRRINNVI